jgi:hypothetical protein
MKDRRRKIRSPSGKPAKVRVTDGFAMRECTIEDQSEDGVRLKLDSTKFVEEQFLLVPGGSGGPARSCRVKWRKRQHVGAEYVSSAKREGN